MNDFADHEEELFPITDEADLLKKVPELVDKPKPFHHLHELWDFWDFLSKGPTETTIQCRDALTRDITEMGISD